MDRLTLFIKCFVVALLVWTANAAFADQQFTVSGSMTSLDDLLTGTYTPGATFQAIVHYDSSLAGVTATGRSGNTATWAQGATEISYTVYDASGNQIYTADLLSTSSDPNVTAYGNTMTSDSGTSQTAAWSVSDSDSVSSESASVSFSDTSGQLFLSYSVYPDPTQFVGRNGTFSFTSTSAAHIIYGVGTINSISFGPADSDGDGITDNLDQCPHSIMTPTVVFHGRDTGIENTLQPDGCTLMDLLAAGERPENWMKKHGLKHCRSEAKHHRHHGREHEEETSSHAHHH